MDRECLDPVRPEVSHSLLVPNTKNASVSWEYSWEPKFLGVSPGPPTPPIVKAQPVTSE